MLVVGLGAAAALSLTACQPDRGSGTAASNSPTSTAPSARLTPTPCGTYSGRGCASARERVDLVRPTFSNPTKVTNPLFPISQLHSAVLLGHVDGKPFRSETTLLPNAERIAWDGQEVETLVSQYVAYLDGRLEEVARERYAQADDGSVWYFGEDVIDSPAAVTWRPWPWPCPRTRSLVPHRPSSGPSRPTPWGSWSWPASLNGRHPRPPSSAWARPGTRFGPPPGPRQWSPVAWATPFTPSRTR
jgi:hypothetical protein